MAPTESKFTKPRSRRNKKQLAAHLDPDLVERMKTFARRKELSLTEIIAMSVNEAVSRHGVGPLLQVSRERLVRRVRSPSQVQTKGPVCRTGTKRVAAFFNESDIDRVRAFSKEKGISQEHLIEEGLRKILSGGNRALRAA
ncbi:hypothetical protein GOB57_09650 [Sinorhizobium meliloti]|nr:hypothetical protein [Sinorhizobium meliloti]